MAEEYLGDGLYVSFDGWMLTLRAPRSEGDHWVGLEPEVYQALLNFVDRTIASKAAPQVGGTTDEHT